MSKPRKGVSKRNRACGLCKPHRAEGNGGSKAKYAVDERRDVVSYDRYEVQS